MLAGLLGQMFLFAFAFTTFTSGFALFAERTFTWNGRPFSPREIGYLFAYAGFVGILLQGGLIGRLVKRFGEPSLVGAGFLAMAAAYVGLGLTHSVGPLIGVATMAAFGQGVLRPTLTSLITQNAKRTEQGVVLGLTQSLTSLAQVTAPPLGGVLIGAGHLATVGVRRGRRVGARPRRDAMGLRPRPRRPARRRGRRRLTLSRMGCRD